MPQPSSATPARAREYETIYILRPDVDTEGAGKVATRVTEVVAREAGMLSKVESWGRRKLAYPVRKYRKGVYLYLRFVGGGALVTELERNFRMLKDSVLKFQTVQLGEVEDVAAVKVDPEEVKFAAIEPLPEDEREEPREKLLGLFDTDHGMRDHDRGRGRAEPEDDEDMARGAGEGSEPAEEESEGARSPGETSRKPRARAEEKEP
jgi:small subunit ribosomal protein S6